MKPVYVKKADPGERLTWMDKFIASEPSGGFQEVVARMALNNRSRVVFEAIVNPAFEREKAVA